MSTVKLTVENCSSSSNGGFILTLKTDKIKHTEETAFGKKTTETQKTYYMKVDEQQPVGKQGELDLSQFRIVPRPFTIPEGEFAGKEVMLDWLHLPTATA